MVAQHALSELTARLGAPHFEQFTTRSGEPAQMLVHWGCGCAAIGAASGQAESAALAWSRCGHHAAAAHELPA